MTALSYPVACFSPNNHQFVFQASSSQKNAVDIYPLDESNNYSVNSSLVSHIDYETNDLQASDLIFTGWCSASGDDANSSKTKRKHDDDIENGKSVATGETFLVNGFPQGKIVVYSSNGKDIVNIIENKKEILHADTEGSIIWILDSDKTVKKFQYNQQKPLKTFHLIDGKDEDVTYFKTLNVNDILYLCVITQEYVYIIDPTKRRPTTLTKFEIFDGTACEIMNNSIVITDKKGVHVYDFTSGDLIQTWEVEAKELKVINNMTVILDGDRNIKFFKIGEEGCVSTVMAKNSEIIQYAAIKNNIMIAWLNVNEPNFEILSLENINNNKQIVVNKDTIEKVIKQDTEEVSENTKVSNHIFKKKVTKAEQDELSQSLIEIIESDGSKEDILTIILSDNWTEPRIKQFISTQLTSEELTSKLFIMVAEKLEKNPWDKNDLLPMWLKWLLTLKSTYLNSPKMKQAAKHMRHLKSSLKISGETFPILLGIQGRLEMLKRQAKLRQELAVLRTEVDEDKVETVEHTATQEVVADNEDSITYANGESDTFFDAAEYTN